MLEIEALRHRERGYKLLSGNGLEIGAFNAPATLPRSCRVEYCDAQSRESAITLFPELELNNLVVVDHICDLDTQGLDLFKDKAFDFVILNHVIEHVANPINIIGESFRICRGGGKIVISAPDKDFTFDKARDLTPFDHLLTEFEDETTQVSDAHYIDFLEGVHPEVMRLSQAEIDACLKSVRLRREHAHVWNSSTFCRFLDRSMELLCINASCLLQLMGSENKFEYFSVWQKA